MFTSEVTKLATVLKYHTVDLLSYQDGYRFEDGFPGLTYTSDCMAVFQEMHPYIMSLAHEQGESFPTMDAYVWFYVNENIRPVIEEWQKMGYVYTCDVCGRLQYSDITYHINDEVTACSKECYKEHWDNYDVNGVNALIVWAEDGDEQEVFISFEHQDEEMPWEHAVFMNLREHKSEVRAGFSYQGHKSVQRFTIKEILSGGINGNGNEIVK